MAGDGGARWGAAHGSTTGTAELGPGEQPTRGPQAWVPLSDVDITDVEVSYVEAALKAGWVSGTAPSVGLFEERLSERLQRNHSVAVSSGTAALELVLRALSIGPGDDVIVPALTFAAPATSVLAVGARPVLADVAPESWTLSAADVARRLTGRTRAIIAVDVVGHPADYDSLATFGLPIIEDAAEAHGCRYKGRPAGSLGDASVLSFHANKPVTTGEGGSISTDSESLAARMRLIAHHGMHPERPYVMEVVGRNFRMPNLAAALGLGQLDRWDHLIAARNRVSSLYSTLLDDSLCGHRPVARWAEYGCWLHTVTVDRREGVLRRVRACGVDARAIWPPLAEQPIIRDDVDAFPVARDISRRAMWLPTYAGLTDEEVEHVADIVAAAVEAESRP